MPFLDSNSARIAKIIGISATAPEDRDRDGHMDMVTAAAALPWVSPHASSPLLLTPAAPPLLSLLALPVAYIASDQTVRSALHGGSWVRGNGRLLPFATSLLSVLPT